MTEEKKRGSAIAGILGSRKWLVPLMVAALFIGLDLGGIDIEAQTFWGTITLVLGSVAAEGAKDTLAQLAPILKMVKMWGINLPDMSWTKPEDAPGSSSAGEGSETPKATVTHRRSEPGA